MLVARRDPPLHAEAAHDPRIYGHPVRHTSRLMSAVQVISTLVAIPVGLASVYSIYHSNFTVEARCETLRGSIISMLDKSTDASTLRMLVRRDVVTFETSCGAIDPDAVKAFKALLAAKVEPKAAPKAAEPPKQVVHEPAPKPVELARPAAPPKLAPLAPVVEAKPAEIKPTEIKPAEPKPVRRDAETSDANWINSVRDALTHSPAHDDAVDASAPAEIATPAVSAPPPRVLGQLPVMSQPPAASPGLAAPPAIAPALPEPVPVAAAPAPAPAADHPVPPAAIPDAQPGAQPLAKSAEPKSSHSWLAKIPLVNRVVGD
jgi:hypothetical protein